MGTFTNLVFKSVTGISDKKYTTTTGPLSLVLQSLNRFKLYLQGQDASATNIITGFLLDQDSVCDQLTRSSVLHLSGDTFGEIDSEVAQSILAAINETSVDHAITLTDISGNAVQMIRNPNVASPKVLVANPLQLYFDDNTITIEGGLDYLIEKLSLTPTGDTIIDKLAAIVEHDTGEAPSENATVLDLAELTAQGLTHDGTILGCVVSRVMIEVGGIAYDMQDSDIIMKYDNGKYYLNNVVSTTRGANCCLWELLSNAIESQSLNDVLLTYAELATSGVTSPDAYVSAYVEFANSKFSSVRNAALSLRKSFAAGGIYGLAKAILNFAKSAESITADNGSLIFTDNAKFTPQEYIAGLMTTIFSGIGALAQAIGMVFRGVLGAVIGIFGAVVSSIVQAINYDYSSTKGSLVDEQGVAAPISPYGIFQFEFPYSNASGQITDFLTTGNPCVLFEVPGGWLLMGYGEFDSEGEPTSLRCEFHPGLDRNDSGFSLLDDKVNITYDSYSSCYVVETAADITAATLKSISVYSYDEDDAPQVYDNGDDGLLSDGDDDIIRANIFLNAAIFYAWFFGLTPVGNTVVIPTGTVAYVGHESSDDAHYWITDWFNVFTRPIASAADLWKLIGVCYQFIKLREQHTTKPFSGPSYAELAQFATTMQSASTAVTYAMTGLSTSSIITQINNRKYYGYPQGSSGSLKYAIKLPEYNRATFFKWIALGAVVTAVVAAATVAITVGVRSFIRRKQAISAAKVYKADENLKNSPTADNYKAYMSAVRKNNLLATLTGGTKYDKVNVWNAAGQATTDSNGIVTRLLGYANPFTDKDFAGGQTIDQGEFLVRGMDEVYHSITGGRLILD